jgi:5-methylcytosine-specific restriction enzyme subunit McrC
MRVHYQRADRSIILNASTGQPYARVVPDILVERSAADTTARLAIDAKYKLYDERKLSSSDVYQSFFTPLPTAPLAVQPSLRHFSCIRLRVGRVVPSAFGSAVRRPLLRPRFLRLACLFRTSSPS